MGRQATLWWGGGFPLCCSPLSPTPQIQNRRPRSALRIVEHDAASVRFPALVLLPACAQAISFLLPSAVLILPTRPGAGGWGRGWGGGGGRGDVFSQHISFCTPAFNRFISTCRNTCRFLAPPPIHGHEWQRFPPLGMFPPPRGGSYLKPKDEHAHGGWG